MHLKRYNHAFLVRTKDALNMLCGFGQSIAHFAGCVDGSVSSSCGRLRGTGVASTGGARGGNRETKTGPLLPSLGANGNILRTAFFQRPSRRCRNKKKFLHRTCLHTCKNVCNRTSSVAFVRPSRTRFPKRLKSSPLCCNSGNFQTSVSEDSTQSQGKEDVHGARLC